MKHPSLIALAGAVLVAAPPRAAQAPAAHSLRGEVRGEGQLLTGAQVTYHPGPTPGLQLWASWPELYPPPPPRDGATNPRGRFRLALPPGHDGRQGVLEVRHPAGATASLGALLFRPAPITLVVCRPMAEVELPTRGTVHLQAVDPDGHPHPMAPVPDTARLRLPAGTYNLLVLGRDFACEYPAVRLRPGHRQRLAATADPGRRLRIPPAATAVVRLRHWPLADLPVHDQRAWVPGGSPVQALALVTHQGCQLLQEVWIDQPAGALPATGAAAAVRQVRIHGEDGAPLAGARVLAARADPRLRVLSTAVTDATGTASYLADPDPATRLVVVADGHVTLARPLPDDSPTRLALRAGERLQLQVLDPRGQPAPRVAVEFLTADQPLLTSVRHTDGRGVIDRHDLARGDATVRLRHPAFLDEELPVRVTPGEPNRRTVRARPGFRVRGRVVLPGGGPAVGAIVTLRDSTGRTDIFRTTVTDAHGAFAVTGLPEHFRLRLSARLDTPRGPLITSQLSVVPDDVGYHLQLKSEDPRFPGRK